ncbi:hypothetical protein KAW65_02975 [candidate division WOR-3 bacterium]|nr:hypothetical protein [candidate division WOR-3 bacterium]
MEDILALLIPILAVGMSLLIPILVIYFEFRKKMLKTKERMLAIEKGVPLPPEPPEPPKKPVTPLDTLRKGFVCLGIGVALVIFTLVADISKWFMGGGLALLFIGTALVLWYGVATRKEKQQS